MSLAFASGDAAASPSPVERYSHLFQAGAIGGVALKNRLVMAPMTTRGADDDGFVTEHSIAYYKARAEAKVGLITVEMASPEAIGRHRFRELGIYDDRFVPGLERLVRVIQDAGAKASIQLGHGGAHTRPIVCGGTPVSASAVPHPVVEHGFEVVMPEAMSQQRIVEAVDAFAAAFDRARRAGFDMAEIHAAHGYLISQFLTPAENTRDDDYGGPLENRARFALEIVRACKARCPDFPLIFRMNGDDFFAAGMPFDEARQLAIWAAEAGADAIHVTAGHYRSVPSAAIMIPPMAEGVAPFAELARQIRRRVSVPVIAVGRLGDPVDAERAVQSGAADFIALGRPLLADPEWAARARAGRPIRACLACNTCVDEMRDGNRLHCLVNPVAGRELEFSAQRTGPANERIAVVGAGPAGLSYASEAARTNDVTVFEKAARAGGALNLAHRAPRFQTVEPIAESFVQYIASLEARCDELGVERRYGVDPLAEPAALDGFDRIVIATGARYRFGAGPIIRALLEAGALKKGPLARIALHEGVRKWFYHSARRGDGAALAKRLGTRSRVEVIGDAARAGKSIAAVKDAFIAAHFGANSSGLRKETHAS